VCCGKLGCVKGGRGEPAAKPAAPSPGKMQEELSGQPASEEGVAETPDPEGIKARKSLLELFDFCGSGDYEKAAEYIVYRGPDETRKWKSVCDYGNAEEKKQVEGVCGRIKGYLTISDRFELGQFTTEEESEGKWLVWEVIFFAGEKKEKVYFAFLQVGERYAVGDIDD